MRIKCLSATSTFTIAVSTTTNAPTTASSCYIKDNMDWNGADAYNELLLGGSMVDCQTLCRDQGIQNFVWVKTNDLCVCKAVVNGEISNSCCISGHAIGGSC